MVHISYTMSTRGLPDLYTLGPQACGPRASGVHIRQTTCVHGITITYTTLTLKIKGNHRCIYLIYPVVMAMVIRYISRRHGIGDQIYPIVMATGYIQDISWQRGFHMSHCCGNMPGYISGAFHFWSIACITSSLYHIQFNKCICNLTSEYSFNCGLKFFLICLTWYILKWYISLI